MKPRYLKVLNENGDLQGAFEFQVDVPLPKKVETLELLRMNNFKTIEVSKDEYDKIERKLKI